MPIKNISLSFHDNFSNQLKKFVPLEQNKIKMYVCGITPDGPAHLGHAFTFITYDTLRRFFTYVGYDVKYVQNVTDIDDPLIEKARKAGLTEEAMAKKWTDYLLNEFNYLNIQMPTHYVKASSELNKMQEIIKSLIEKEYAYVVGGNVYFEVSKFPNYGKLSKLSRQQMIDISAERGANPNDPNKRDPLDFVLWREPNGDEPVFESPWGKGRPGWHIECTAMISQFLGEQIDIHGGGGDLLYPHHESEIAQIESYTGKSPFTEFWMECGMVFQDGAKMSKSKGNITFAKDLATKYYSNVIRHYLLSHHYRSEWEFNREEIDKNCYKILGIEEKIKTVSQGISLSDDHPFIQALANDFDVPTALEVLLKTHDAAEARTMFELLGFRTD